MNPLTDIPYTEHSNNPCNTTWLFLAATSYTALLVFIMISSLHLVSFKVKFTSYLVISQLILSSGTGRQDTSIVVVFNSVAETFVGEAHGAKNQN